MIDQNFQHALVSLFLLSIVFLFGALLYHLNGDDMVSKHLLGMRIENENLQMKVDQLLVRIPKA